jgi:hypothetical protein
MQDEEEDDELGTEWFWRKGIVYSY